MTSCGIFPSGDFRPGSLRKATTDDDDDDDELPAERRRNADGCRKLLRYRLFSRRLCRTENVCVYVSRCGAVSLCA